MPIVPEAADPIQEELKRRREEKRQAIRELEALVQAKVTLARHVFFVPGWAGEEGKCWSQPYPTLMAGHRPMKAWMDRLLTNPDHARYVSYVRFTMAESRACPTFIHFAEVLKARIRRTVSAKEPLDLIGHSMGALDIIAALTLGNDPLRNPVVNCVAVGSPLRGVSYGNLVHRVHELLPLLAWEPHHYEQLRNLDSGAGAIKLVNTLATRKRLFDRIEYFWGLIGTQDAVVGRNAKLKTDDLPPAAKARVITRGIAGAMHTGAAGMTQDPRTAWDLVRILLDIPLPDTTP